MTSNCIAVANDLLHVATKHQPLDRPVAPLADPGLRDVRCAHIAPLTSLHRWACHRVAALRLPRRELKGKRHQPRAVLGSPPTEAANEITSRQLRLRSPRRGRPEVSPVRGAKRRCAGGYCPDTKAEQTLGLSAARGRGRIWPPRNSLNCGLRSTWSRCHTNRSTVPVRRSPTQGCATFAALASLHRWACHRVAALRLPRREPKGRRQQPTGLFLGSPPSEAGRCDRHWLRSQGSLSQKWHERSSNDIANSGGFLDRRIARERLRVAYGEGWKSP
jgi:hypothetical protein